MRLPLFPDFLVPVTIPCGLDKIRLSAPLTVGLVLGRAVRCCRISTQHASYLFLALSLSAVSFRFGSGVATNIRGKGKAPSSYYFQRGPTL